MASVDQVAHPQDEILRRDLTYLFGLVILLQLVGTSVWYTKLFVGFPDFRQILPFLLHFPAGMSLALLSHRWQSRANLVPVGLALCAVQACTVAFLHFLAVYLQVSSDMAGIAGVTLVLIYTFCLSIAIGLLGFTLTRVLQWALRFRGQ